MATLASGASVTINLSAGQSVEFTESGVGQAIYGVGKTPVQLGGARKKIGPFPSDEAVYVSSISGALTYTLYQAPVVADPRVEQTSPLDSSGNPAPVVSGQRMANASGIYPRVPQSVVLKRMGDQVGVTISGTVTAAIDSTTSPFGRPALKLTNMTGNVEVAIAGLNLTKFDSHIVMPVWVSDYTLVQNITAYAGTTGFGRNYAQTYQLAASDGNRWNGEHAVAVGPLRSSAEATFVTGVDTLNEAKFRLTTTSAGLTVWVDCFKLVPKSPGIILWTFDDGFKSWNRYIQPMMERTGFKGAFGIQSSTVGTNPNLYSDPSDLLALAMYGHDVGPHQVTNTRYNDGTGGTQTAAQYQTDFRTSKNAVMGWTQGLGTASFHAYVQGGVNTALMDVLQNEGLRIGRGTDALGHNFHSAGLGRSALALKTRYLEGADSVLIGYKQDIVDCAKYGTTLVFMGHDFAPGAAVAPSIWKTELMEELVNFAASKIGPDLMCMTPTQYQSMLAQQKLAEINILNSWPV